MNLVACCTLHVWHFAHVISVVAPRYLHIQICQDTVGNLMQWRICLQLLLNSYYGCLFFYLNCPVLVRRCRLLVYIYSGVAVTGRGTDAGDESSAAPQFCCLFTPFRFRHRLCLSYYINIYVSRIFSFSPSFSIHVLFRCFAVSLIGVVLNFVATFVRFFAAECFECTTPSESLDLHQYESSCYCRNGAIYILVIQLLEYIGTFACIHKNIYVTILVRLYSSKTSFRSIISSLIQFCNVSRELGQNSKNIQFKINIGYFD